MKVHEYFWGILATQPVCLRAAGQGDGRRRDLVGYAVLVVYGRACGTRYVAILGKVEVAEVRAEEGGRDVFVVGGCPVGTFEGGDEGSACCGGDWDVLDGLCDMREWRRTGLQQC